MSLDPHVKLCSHIKVTGVRCGSPALRDEAYCYFHLRMFRGVPTPKKSRIHPIALIENEESIQAALMETINAIVRNQIDLPRAHLILRALSIAVRNSRNVSFDTRKSEMVRELPEPEPEAKPKEAETIYATSTTQALLESSLGSGSNELAESPSEAIPTPGKPASRVALRNSTSIEHAKDQRAEGEKRSTQVLRRESPASRATPLPQDDNVEWWRVVTALALRSRVLRLRLCGSNPATFAGRFPDRFSAPSLAVAGPWRCRGSAVWDRPGAGVRSGLCS
jgi:hypothetical protein